VPLDRLDDLAMLAVFPFHVHRDHGVDRRQQEQHRKDPAEQETEHDQHDAEHGRERLSVEQQAERRQQSGQDVDHFPSPRAERAII
jgi:hypothetical protein